MIFQSAWERFRTDWTKFLLIGLGPFLIGLVFTVIMGILLVATVGPTFFSAIQSAAVYGSAPSSDLFVQMMGSFLLFWVLVMVGGVVISGLTYGGLVGTVAEFRNGGEVGLGQFWSNATRYFGRFVGLTLLSGLVTFGIMLISMVLFIIPVVGWIAPFLIQLILLIYLGIYAGYLIVSEDMGVVDAIGAGFKAIFRNFGEAVLAGLVFLGFSVVMGLVGLINIIPILGQLVWIGLMLLWSPFMVYYFIERFEVKVRPTLN